MSARKIHVTLTAKEADALVRLAECSANTWEDAIVVLDTGIEVAAGFRAIEKLNRSIYRERS